MCSDRDAAGSQRRVSPFGNPRIDACTRLPEAYRSVPRPSSAFGAKASTVSPYYLAHVMQRNRTSSISFFLFVNLRSIQLVRCWAVILSLLAVSAAAGCSQRSVRSTRRWPTRPFLTTRPGSSPGLNLLPRRTCNILFREIPKPISRRLCLS